MAEHKQTDDESIRILEAFREASERGDVHGQEVAGMRMLAQASRNVEPSPQLEATLEARRREHASKWSEAEVAHQRAVELALGTAHNEYKAYSDYAALLRLLDRDEEALAESTAALEAAKRTGMDIIVHMASVTLAGTLLGRGDIEGAAAVAEEAIRTSAAGTRGDAQRARGMVLRALCAVRRGDSAAARADLDAAWPLLAPLANSTLLVGPVSALASWWAVASRVNAAQGDLSVATEAMGESVRLRRVVAQAPQVQGPYTQNSLAGSLARYAVALLAAGDPAAAESAYDESTAIRASLGLPPITLPE